MEVEKANVRIEFPDQTQFIAGAEGISASFVIRDLEVGVGCVRCCHLCTDMSRGHDAWGAELSF